MRKNLTFRTAALLSIAGGLAAGALLSAVFVTNPVSGRVLSVIRDGTVSVTDPAGKCGYYTNSRGIEVPRPCGNWRNDPTPPSGATARCRDGSWSWSQHPYYRGTCNYHGGVESYL